MKITKKILAAFLAALMAISMMPFTVFAAPPGSSETGTGTGGISIGGGSTVVGEGPYLTFTGTESFSIKTHNSAKNWDGTLEYSTDTNTWTTWDGTSQISSVNDVLYLRGTGNTQITGSGSSSKYWVITTQGTVACSGDIRTLLDYNNPEGSSMGNFCFSYLFRNCTSLTAAPALPATVLTYDCYYHMFDGCRSLTTAPELPATTLAQECYSYMFYGCKSLTTAPALPATTLINNCYSYMFAGCTSLTTAPALPATTLARHCYYYMFEGCTSLTTAPELPATTLAEYCYQNMFNGCENLTTAPELWATSLAPSCYSDMFNGCRSLTTAPQLPATTLESYCYYDMFNGCTSLTTAPELPATTLTYGCYRSMFQGCTSLTTPSELPATTLTSSCYNGMFRGCTGIKLSTEQTAEYSTPYSIPKQGTAESVGNYALTDMFTGTGGTFTGTPTINTTYYIPAPAPTEPEPTVTWYAATENIQIGWDCNQSNPYDASYTKDAITVSATSEEGQTYIDGTRFMEGFMGDLSGFVFTNSVANFSKIKLVFTDLSIVSYNQFLDSEYNVDPNWSSDLDSKTVTWEGDSNSVGLYAYGVSGTLDRIEFTIDDCVPVIKPDGFNLTVEDKIHMNLYINVDDYTDAENATVTVTYNDPEKQTPTLKVDTYSGEALAALKDAEDGRYVIPVLAAPAQIRDNVSVTVTDRDDSITTSVAEYCETIIAQSEDAELVALAKAILDYGKACSAEFNYNVDGFEEQAYYNTDDVSYILDEEAKLNSADANGKFAGYSYIAKAVPALRIYLNTTEAEVVANDLKATVNGTEVTPKVEEGTDRVCVDITGILAEDLDAEYTIEFNGGTLKLNALQYAKAKGDNTDFSRSMCEYWFYAHTYFK